MSKKTYVGLLFSLLVTCSFGQIHHVVVNEDEEGFKLIVNEEDFMVNGMNWDYIPIGSNYNFSLWSQDDDFIKTALETEMSLLRNMGVNVIRQYTGVPPEWITYIYDQYGIMTMLNHAFGRYGVAIGDDWIEKTDYSNDDVRKQLLAEVESLASNYQHTRGLLLYLLGNENNYGLFWEGAETADIPEVDQTSIIHARAMYKLFNEASLSIKSIDTSHPVAMCNGDLLFLDIIAETCKDVDVFGSNVYRGKSFGDVFQRVKDELNMPIMITEFGADAFHSINNKEDQMSQAYYLVNNWKEIYENATGLGKAQNSIGGFTFQFSDGWWKYGQTKNLLIHDTNASWKNEGYTSDLTTSGNNMNEEWFGICAKEPSDERGLYKLTPRLAYFKLKEVHSLDVYSSTTTLNSIKKHFLSIEIEQLEKKVKKVRVKLK